MGWVFGGLAVVCLAVGLFHLARLAARRRDVASELADAAMGLGMAAMFSPLGDPVPDPVWTVVFLFSALWFAAGLLRSRTLNGDAGHHVIGSTAMLFMLAVGHAAEHPAAPAGHAAHAEGAAGAFGLVSGAALVLTGYFAWHALRCAERCRRPGPAAPDTASQLHAAPAPDAAAVALRAPTRSSFDTPQLAAAAHLVLAVAMALMVLGMV